MAHISESLDPTTPATSGVDSWINPEYLQTFAPASCRVITLPAGIVTLILGNDSQRAGFIVMKSAAMNSFPRIGPTPDVAKFGLREDNSVDVRTFALTDWLSLIIGEWYAFSTLGGDVMLCEFKPSF